jgi:hypothetical protein
MAASTLYAKWMCMKTRRRFRRFLLVLLLLLIGGAGIWTALWYNISGRLISQVAAFEAARRAEGWTISHDAPVRTGWPMAAGVRLGHLSVSGGRAYWPGGMGWTAGKLTIALDIRHPHSLYIGISGRQTVSLGGRAPIPFQAQHMAGEAAFQSGWQLGLMQISADGILAAVPAKGGAGSLSISSMAAALRLDPAAGPAGEALGVAAEAAGVHIPPSHMAALGDVSRFAFDVTASGPWPAASAKADAFGSARAWAAAGGTLRLNRFELAAGPLRLGGQGVFRLDPHLMPDGLITAKASGLVPAVRLLAAKHIMTAHQARAAAAVLGVLIRPAGATSLTAPLSLHGGIVSLGPVPLLHLGG